MTGGATLDDGWLQLLTPRLDEARQLGYLGPPPAEEQIARSLAFGACAPVPPQLAVDLGSGAGVPALALAMTWPASHWVLVDSNEKRAAWLSQTVKTLGLADRCQIVCDRAEDVGRGRFRHSADLVTARSFAPASPTAESAAPFLKLGGQLLVSCPPGSGAERWPARPLAELGLVFSSAVAVPTLAGPQTVARLTCASLCSERFPRRVGIPSKRPLF